MLLKDAALVKVPGISFDVEVVVSDFELAMVPGFYNELSELISSWLLLSLHASDLEKG